MASWTAFGDRDYGLRDFSLENRRPRDRHDRLAAHGLPHLGDERMRCEDPEAAGKLAAERDLTGVGPRWWDAFVSVLSPIA